MKKILILSVSLIFTGSFMMTVHAEEGLPGTEQAATEETPAEREVYAKSLFEGRCQMCHQLPEPGMLRPKQWRLILTTMQQRMQQAGVPPLTEEETETVLEYIAEQSR